MSLQMPTLTWRNFVRCGRTILRVARSPSRKQCHREIAFNRKCPRRVGNSVRVEPALAFLKLIRNCREKERIGLAYCCKCPRCVGNVLCAEVRRISLLPGASNADARLAKSCALVWCTCGWVGVVCHVRCGVWRSCCACVCYWYSSCALLCVVVGSVAVIAPWCVCVFACVRVCCGGLRVRVVAVAMVPGQSPGDGVVVIA